jgi:hypothetical protein
MFRIVKVTSDWFTSEMFVVLTVRVSYISAY